MASATPPEPVARGEFLRAFVLEGVLLLLVGERGGVRGGVPAGVEVWFLGGVSLLPGEAVPRSLWRKGHNFPWVHFPER